MSLRKRSCTAATAVAPGALAAALALSAMWLVWSSGMASAQGADGEARAGPAPVLVLGELTVRDGRGDHEATGEAAASGQTPGAPTTAERPAALPRSAPAPISEPEVRRALSAWWEEHLAGRLRLLPDSASGAQTPSPNAAVSIQVEGWGSTIRVTTTGSDGRRVESRALVFSGSLESLVPALAGEMLAGWSRTQGYPAPKLAPPRLAALLELSTLSGLDGGPAPESEPLDCAAGPAGPVLLFSDRTLSLGKRLELLPESMRDLSLRPGLPEGLVPSYLCVDPWGQALVYGEGAIVRYDPEALSPRRTVLPSLGAQDFAGLAGGGFAVLAPGRIVEGARKEDGVVLTERRTPSPFQAAAAGDPRGGLWLYDLSERRIRVLAVPGDADSRELREVGSVTPLISAEELPFPQVMKVFPDGGFVLGGSGRLWRFDPTGWPLWRLEDFGAGVRQSLPAFYRVALDGERAFYLLDAPSRRLLRFVDLEEGPIATGSVPPQLRFAEPPEPVDVELAGLFRRWSEAPALPPSGDPSPRERARGELVEACLKRDFLLMAQSLEPGPQEADGHGAAGGSRVGGERGAPSDRSRAVREKQAGLLAELARRYEEQLLLPGAEEACNAALRVLRALRAQDPVDPRYPERIRELERQRNDVREILVAEPGLELLPPQVGGGGLDAGASGAAPRAGESTSRALTLELRNVTGGSLRDLRFQVRVPGLPAGTLAAVIPRLAPGGTATLNARVPAANGPLGAHVREDLRTRVLVLVTATDEDGERTFWLQAPLLVPPPGTGPPAGTPAGAR